MGGKRRVCPPVDTKAKYTQFPYVGEYYEQADDNISYFRHLQMKSFYHMECVGYIINLKQGAKNKSSSIVHSAK